MHSIPVVVVTSLFALIKPRLTFVSFYRSLDLNDIGAQDPSTGRIGRGATWPWGASTGFPLWLAAVSRSTTSLEICRRPVLSPAVKIVMGEVTGKIESCCKRLGKITSCFPFSTREVERDHSHKHPSQNDHTPKRPWISTPANRYNWLKTNCAKGQLVEYSVIVFCAVFSVVWWVTNAS